MFLLGIIPYFKCVGQGHLEEGHIPQEEGQTHPEGGLEAGWFLQKK